MRKRNDEEGAQVDGLGIPTEEWRRRLKNIRKANRLIQRLEKPGMVDRAEYNRLLGQLYGKKK
jgi:hypothetical protein